jgi:hypothetical protein
MRREKAQRGKVSKRNGNRPQPFVFSRPHCGWNPCKYVMSQDLSAEPTSIFAPLFPLFASFALFRG